MKLSRLKYLLKIWRKRRASEVFRRERIEYAFKKDQLEGERYREALWEMLMLEDIPAVLTTLEGQGSLLPIEVSSGHGTEPRRYGKDSNSDWDKDFDRVKKKIRSQLHYTSLKSEQSSEVYGKWSNFERFSSNPKTEQRIAELEVASRVAKIAELAIPESPSLSDFLPGYAKDEDWVRGYLSTPPSRYFKPRKKKQSRNETPILPKVFNFKP